MKNGERVIWISVVTVLLIVSLFAIFIKDASAGSMSGEMPYMMKFKRVFDIIKSDYVDESKTDNLTLINGAIKGMIDSIGDPHTNYLSEKEVNSLNLLTTAFLDMAEDRASRHIIMNMADWKALLERYLQISDRDILPDAVSVTHEEAEAKALGEYEKFWRIQDETFLSDFDKFIEEFK